MSGGNIGKTIGFGALIVVAVMFEEGGSTNTTLTCGDGYTLDPSDNKCYSCKLPDQYYYDISSHQCQVIPSYTESKKAENDAATAFTENSQQEAKSLEESDGDIPVEVPPLKPVDVN
jgi:hypothetical protein